MFEVTVAMQKFTSEGKDFYAFGLICNNQFFPLHCFRDPSEIPGITGGLIDQLVNLANLYTEKMPIPGYVIKAFEKDDLF